MDRRSFLKGLVATAAGVLVPSEVLAEPDRRVWALDRTMVAGNHLDTGWFDTGLRHGMWLVEVRTGEERFIPIEGDGAGGGILYIPAGTWTGKYVQWSLPFSDPGRYHLRGGLTA
jgi:hypothetical protein